jgi:hypothetical protein
MTAQPSLPLNYVALEKEWLSLSSPEEKSLFWNRMRLLFAELDEGQIERFFVQLQKNADEISVRLELAQKRAEMAGFQSNPS